MITTTVSFDDFWTWLNKDKDSSYYQYFSYEGAKALFEYLEELSDSTSKNMDFDPIDWTSRYTEYNNLKEFNQAYNSNNPFDSWEQVAENTIVIPIGDGEHLVSDGAIVAEF